MARCAPRHEAQEGGSKRRFHRLAPARAFGAQGTIAVNEFRMGLRERTPYGLGLGNDGRRHAQRRRGSENAVTFFLTI